MNVKKIVNELNKLTNMRFFNRNYKKIIEKLPQLFSLSLSKSVIILGLLIYWGIILAGTLLQAN